MLLLQIVVCVFSRFLITGAPAVDFQNENESFNSDNSYVHDIATRKPEDKLGSCTIPTVENGSVGYYEKVLQLQTNQYIPFQVGTALKHGETAILLCTEGFVPHGSSKGLGAQSSSDTVTCENGMWSKPLLCKPASCLGEPPPMDNGNPVVNNRSHGHVINYLCNEHYVKVQSGIVKCHYGNWKGRPPVCAYVVIPFNSTTISTVSIQATTAMGSISRKTRDSNSVVHNDAEPSSPAVENLLPVDCVCTYFHQDRNLHAIVNGKIIIHGIRLRKGETGMLRCANSSMNLVWPNGACSSKSVSLTCNECGAWKKDHMPSCQFSQLDPDIHCTKFSHKGMYLLNVQYDDKDIRVGSRAIFSCRKRNQKIIGTNEAVCLRSGEWSLPEPPECTDVKTENSSDINPLCNDIRCARFSDEDVDQLIVNYDDNDVRVGSTANFSCRNDNQIINGTNVAVCLRNGEWSSPPPRCREPQNVCPPVKENGAFDVVYSNDRHINSTATFYCKDVKHLTEGLHIRTCLSTGKWSEANPTCRVSDVRCSKFSDEDTRLLDVHYDDSSFRAGSTATFSCIKNGQRLNGSTTAVCRITEEWSSPPPQCIEPQTLCPPIKENKAFDVVYSNERNINSTATFYCKDVNHLIEGLHIRTCLSTGQWSDANPTCKDPIVRCTRFSVEDMNLLNVHYDGIDSRAGSTATFSCSKNDHNLIGSALSVCLRTGQWSSPPPQCNKPQILCPPIQKDEAFDVAYSNERNINSTATFYCKDVNYLTKGLHTRTCLSTGQWSDANPTCKDPVIRCTKFSDEDTDQLVVRYDDNDVRVGSTATFSCSENGHMLSGLAVAVCLRTGKWSSPPPQCNKPKTLCPPIQENGAFDIVYSNDRNVNSIAIFHCKDVNHRIEGLHTRTCLSTGKWSGANPMCRDPAIRCTRFSDEDIDQLVVRYDDSDTRAGSKATFSCSKNDHRLSGSVEAVCLKTGQWSSPPPQCNKPPILCPPITENAAFRVVYSNDRNINSIASFHCKDVNHVMEGLPTRTCLSTGKWSGSNPTCKETRCEAPLAPEHGSVLVMNDRKVGSVALYACDNDATLVGPSSLTTCLPNGKWTIPPPKCLRSCVLSPVSGGTVGTYEVVRYRWPNRYETFIGFEEGKVFKHDEKVILHCNQGFMLTENSSFDGQRSIDEVTCENGRWSKSLQCKSSDCTDPAPSILHGKPVNISQEHNSKVAFKCDKGYELKENSTIRCQYGEWTGKPAECVKITTCAAPENPQNGKVTYSSLQFGSDLTAECDEGYRLLQKKPVYCKTDGTWNLSDLKCEVVLCRAPKHMKNGKISYSSLKFGSELVFKCEEGYTLQLTEPVRCLADGTWSRSDVTCEAISCDVPKEPKNGDVFYRSLKFGSVLMFTCKVGHRLHQTKPVYCTSNGTWSTAEVSCSADSCDPPSNPQNGQVTYTSLKLGSQLKFTCNKGYRLQDSVPVYCTSDRVWSKTDVACVVETCDRPKNPENGEVIFTSLKFESQLTFKCNDGYRLQGKEPVYCTLNGTWSSNDVQCVAKTCIRPENPENGQVIYSSLEFGSQLKFNCDNGYSLNSKERVYCTSDGTWNRTDVKCVAKLCDPPEDPKNGQVTFTSLNFESQLTFKCDDGYRLKGKEPVYCTSNGTWSSKDIQCVAKTCNRPEHPENGQVSYSSLEFGSQLKFNCDNGYILNSKEPVYCTSDGTWSRTDVQCLDLKCNRPKHPENGQVTVTSLNVGSQLNFKCDDGYFLQAKGPVYCKLDGTWNNTDVKCVAISCNHPEHPENGQVIYHSLKLGSQLRFRCDDGYKLEDTEPVYCKSDKTWSKTFVRCIAVTCDVPEHPENGQVGFTSLDVGSHLKFKCNDGYRLQANEPVYCTPDRVWSDPDVTCDAISCNRPDHPENGQVSFSSLQFGSRLQFRCDDGYQLQADGPVTCTADGTWSRANVECVGKGCDLPNHPPNGQVIFTSLDYGSELKYKCNHGYSLPLDMLPVFCKPDGTWSRTDVRCEKPCILQSLLLNLPEDLVSETEVDEDADLILIPYGSSVKLRCENNVNPVGDKFAKCGRDRTWEYDEFQCRNNFHE